MECNSYEHEEKNRHIIRIVRNPYGYSIYFSITLKASGKALGKARNRSYIHV